MRDSTSIDGVELSVTASVAEASASVSASGGGQTSHVMASTGIKGRESDGRLGADVASAGRTDEECCRRIWMENRDGGTAERNGPGGPVWEFWNVTSVVVVTTAPSNGASAVPSFPPFLHRKGSLPSISWMRRLSNGIVTKNAARRGSHAGKSREEIGKGCRGRVESRARCARPVQRSLRSLVQGSEFKVCSLRSRGALLLLDERSKPRDLTRMSVRSGFARSREFPKGVQSSDPPTLSRTPIRDPPIPNPPIPSPLPSSSYSTTA